MAALAAGRAACSRAGVKPLLRSFHRKIHEMLNPLPRQRAKPPFLLHLDPSNGCRVVLFRPTIIRYQSTAVVAGAQVDEVAEVASTPLFDEGTLSAGDLGQAVQELTFAELGLGSSTPVGLIQNLLEMLHVNVGLPWWGAIVTGTVVARCLIFPLIVKGQREAAKLNKHMPRVQELAALVSEAKASGDKFQYARAYSDLITYQKVHGFNPLRGFLVPLVQMPIFISFFFALRKMVDLPVPSLKTGGLWWFSDLTVADPYYILPLTVTLTMWAVIELGAESGVSNPNTRTMKMVLRAMPLLILPVTISFPTAIFTYWMTSNFFSLAQVALLRVPAIRTRLRIEKLDDNKPKEPKESMITTLKKGWADVKNNAKIKEREQEIKDQLEMAARGPLRQTFRHNPLEQHMPPPDTKRRPKKNPWEDTLG